MPLDGRPGIEAGNATGHFRPDAEGFDPRRAEPQDGRRFTEGGEQLVAMAEQVEQATEKLGFERERRPFSPHLTLGRVRTPRQPELSEAIQRLREVEIGSMTVDAVYVMRSQLTPKGAIYSVISEIKLSG